MKDLEKDQIRATFNSLLLAAQEVTEERENQLVYLHHIKDKMFALAELLDPKKDEEHLQLLAEALESLEFAMQIAWGFDESWAHHTHWRFIPHCKCPAMDNDDLIGVERRIYNLDCPIHKNKP